MFDLSRLAVFSAGDRSIVWAEENSHGVASATGEYYDTSFNWEGPIKPGDRFRVALVPVSALTPRRAEFITEVPPLPPIVHAAPAAPAEPAPAPR